METKFHRETAEIYDFVPAARPAGRENLVTSLDRATGLGEANVVPIRSGPMPVAPHAVVVETRPRADVGSGWYHGAAIHDAEPPFRH